MGLRGYDGWKLRERMFLPVVCSVCGGEAEVLYFDMYGEACGCDLCVRKVNYWEAEAYDGYIA